MVIAINENTFSHTCMYCTSDPTPDFPTDLRTKQNNGHVTPPFTMYPAPHSNPDIHAYFSSLWQQRINRGTLCLHAGSPE
jgi:hypothetical protein